MLERPNVIVFFTDQQRADACGCYGSPMDLTPNLDEMARRGTRFEHNFTCQPVCGPARGSLQTGRFATAHTVWRNGLPLPEKEATLANYFSQADYEVGYLGKWHLASTRDEPVPVEQRGGYTDFWEGADVLEFTSHPYDARWYNADNEEVHYDGYRVTAQTDRAIEYITRDRERPFFFFLSYLEPHHQNDIHAYVGPKEYEDAYQNPWVPPDLAARPGDWYESLPGYYACVKALDDGLGRIMDTLDETGLTDNTILVFTSDHGCHFRTRNNEYKRSCHEASIRTPLVIDGPGFHGGGAIEQMTSLVDLPPTILSAAGTSVPDAMHGRDAMQLVNGGNPADWQNEVFIQISEAEVGRAIRTERYKYSVYDPDADGGQDSCSDHYVERYLYDLNADPHEQVNLVGRSAYNDVRQYLKGRLIERMKQAGEDEPTIDDAQYYA